MTPFFFDKTRLGRELGPEQLKHIRAVDHCQQGLMPIFAAPQLHAIPQIVDPQRATYPFDFVNNFFIFTTVATEDGLDRHGRLSTEARSRALMST
jgi:hypothetical protein